MNSERFHWSPGALRMIDLLDPIMRPPMLRVIVILSEAEDGVDAAIDQTLRTKAQAAANAASGKGVLESKHLPNEKGHSEALDFRTVGKTQAERYALPPLRIIRGALFQAFDDFGIPTRNGSDWNCNGIEILKDPTEKGQRFDLVHHELVKPSERRYSAALAAMDRRKAARLAGERWPL